MAIVLRTFAIIALALVAGAASIHFKFFPGESLSAAFTALDALRTQYSQRQSTYNRATVFQANKKKRGVTRWKKGATQEGLTLITMGHGKTVELIDMNGIPVHQWNVDYHAIWDDTGDVQNPVPERFIFVRKGKLYPDGRLLVIFSAWSTTPYGYGIAMLDRDSQVLWKDFRFIHHSFDQAADGRIYALDQRIELSAKDEYPDLTTPYLDDGIATYTADGEFISRFSLLDALQKSTFRDAIPFLAAKNSGLGLGDLLHANDVDVLPEHLANKYSFAEAGDLLVSLRQIDSIAIVDPDSATVKWLMKGYWRRQHDADFLDNGNMLIFDNLAFRSSASGKPTSRIIEFNPDNMAIIWEYWPAGDEEFFTPARGSQQRLPNGNTLITESNRARVFEVNQAGEIVWEYFNQTRLGPEEKGVPGILWATRYTLDQAAFL
jgi:hypothetical protein